jgi:hypothetical protein
MHGDQITVNRTLETQNKKKPKRPMTCKVKGNINRNNLQASMVNSSNVFARARFQRQENVTSHDVNSTFNETQTYNSGQHLSGGGFGGNLHLDHMEHEGKRKSLG